MTGQVYAQLIRGRDCVTKRRESADVERSSGGHVDRDTSAVAKEQCFCERTADAIARADENDLEDVVLTRRRLSGCGHGRRVERPLALGGVSSGR